MKRFLKWGLIVGCVGLGVWTFWNVWATNELAKVVKDLSRRGLPTTLAELESGLAPFDSEPAETENAAPIFEAAFALAKSIEPLSDWGPGEGSVVPEDVRDGLPRFDKVFELLYQAAERPRCRFDRDWSDGYAMMMPHISEIRDVATLLRNRAVVRSADGDGEGAIEDVRVIFCLSRSLREEPILINQLIRIAVAEMGLEALRVILPRSESAVEALESTSPDDAAGSMARAFQGELVMSLTIATDAGAWEALDVDTNFDSALTGLAGPYLKSDVAYIADFLGRCIDMAREPYPAALALADSLAVEAEQNGGILTKMLLPAITRAIRSEARHASRVALAGLAARCIDYKREHGKYPAGLGDMKDVEPDPLTGRPFVLEARAEGILLRSERSEDAAGEAIQWEL